MLHPEQPSCSYQIPVEIKTKTQLVGVLRAVTEIQTQRILMGRFAEEVQGEHNPDLGKEMDRLFSMVERWRNIEDNRDTVKVTLDAKGDAAAGMGVLSRLFGAKVGQNATLAGRAGGQQRDHRRDDRRPRMTRLLYRMKLTP